MYSFHTFSQEGNREYVPQKWSKSKESKTWIQQAEIAAEKRRNEILSMTAKGSYMTSAL